MGGQPKMKLSGRERILLAVFLILALALIYHNFIYKPLQITREGLLKENRILTSLIERGTSAEAQNLNIDQEKTRVVNKGNELMQKLPGEPGVPETVAFLKKTAQDSHVILKKLNYTMVNKDKPKTAKDGQKAKDILEKVQILDYNITVQGGYGNLLTFLLKFENAPRLYKISNCRMAANTKKIEQTPSENLPSALEGELVPEPAPLPVIPKGSAIYDGNSIELNLKFSAYYEEEVISGLEASADEVPTAAGRINPFL